MEQPINKEIGSLQRNLCAKSLELFAKTYFPHYCKFPFAKFHRELIKSLEQAAFSHKKKYAGGAPRGSAKSSLASQIFPIWCACYGYDKCIVIFSNTKTQAETFLSNIKHEFNSNSALLRDFPDVCTPPNPCWRKSEIITRNGVNIRVSSVGDAIRGFRFKAYRPSLIIVDDVESTEAIRSQEGRDKLYDWFTKVVLNLGSDNANFIVVGTILHFDSLLAKLTSSERDEFPGFDRAVYKAVISWAKRQDLWDYCMRVYFYKDLYGDKTGPEAAMNYFEHNEPTMLDGAEVLWPEKESYFDLMVLREERGDFAFSSEKMNEPKDPGTLSLDKNRIYWWDDKFETVDDVGKHIGHKLMIFGAVDPAIGLTKRHDYSAIITGFVHRTSGDVYIVDADIGRWSMDELVKRICALHEVYDYSVFLYESNAAQAWLGDAIKKEPSHVPIKPITSTQSKDGRIAKCMMLILRQKVILYKKLSTLNRQLLSYPNVDHDDAVDALAMLVDSVPKEVRISLDEIREILLNRKYPGFNPKDHATVIGFSDGTGHYRPLANPFGMICDKSKPRPENPKIRPLRIARPRFFRDKKDVWFA